MKDPFWIHGLSEADKDLLRRSLEDIRTPALGTPHPPTARAHLSPRTMGIPCTHCGGTTYYCAEAIDSVMGKETRDFDAVMQALSELYEEYARQKQEGPTKDSQVLYGMAKLMDAYNRWLG